ncbi:MAG: hypothetical protein IJQ55_05580 [Alphaproteobacteria bacterium]|nr:hypothetical protein [Alphaproteobacteria bacterium]
MITKLVKERKLKTYQCDRYGYLRPLSLMNKLQGLAGTHAEMLGAGREYCLSRNVAWVMTHMFVDIPDMPRAEEMLVYSTWPSVTDAVRSERDFEITDTKGNLKIRAMSQWVLIDIGTRKPVRISDHISNWEGLPERVWEREFDKGPDFILTKTGVMACRFDDIDVNQHINNAVYTVWATESVGFDFRNTHKLRGIDIYFKHEINPTTPTVRIETGFSGNVSRHKIMTEEVEHAKIICTWENR